MNKISLLLACVLLLLGSANTAPCQGDRANLIQSGIVNVANPRLNNRETCQQVQINYDIPSTGFQAAVCTFYI